MHSSAITSIIVGFEMCRGLDDPALIQYLA
jgi:hypothetical protein